MNRVPLLRPEPLRDVRHWLATLDGFWTDRLRQLGDHLDQKP